MFRVMPATDYNYCGVVKMRGVHYHRALPVAAMRIPFARPEFCVGHREVHGEA